MDRKDFLQSKLETKENVYKGYFSPPKEHIDRVFKPIINDFIPAQTTKEIIDFISDKDLNVCRDKTLIIFFKQTDYRVVNSLKFHLYLNFIANWREYSDMISKIVKGGNDCLTYDTISVDKYYSLNITNNYEEINKIHKTDILFVMANKYIYKGKDGYSEKYYYELFKNLVDYRGISGLVTIVLFLGTDKEFKPIEDKLFGIQYKKVNFNSDIQIKMPKQNKTYNKNENDVKDEEVF